MFLYKTLKFILGLPIKLIFPTKVYGKKPLPEGRCIVASNHLSMMDSVICGVNSKRPVTFLAKQELWSNWFTKWFFNSMGCVPINRQGSDFAAMKKIIGALEEEKAVALFPEGTRNLDAPGELLPFKSGVSMFALRTGSDIVPVILLSKPRPFKKNYMLIGDVIEVTKPEGRIDSELIDGFTAEFQSKMQNQLEELKSRVGNMKTVKKLDKEEEK